LQELTPVHFTFASSALALETDRVANSSAAAVAIATPPALDAIFISLSPWNGRFADYRAASADAGSPNSLPAN
jgi:hypothetical protein